MSQLLRRALGAHVVEHVAAPPNYSVVLADAPESRPAGFHFLYRSSTRVLRTRDPQRLVRGLFSYLSGHHRSDDANLLWLRGVALVGERGVVIAPAVLRQYATQLERRLNLGGARFVDMEAVAIDWSSSEVVVPEPLLEVDWSQLDHLGSVVPGARPDPPVPPGRYPVVGWAFLGQGNPPSRAQAVALATRFVARSAGSGRQHTLDALSHVMRSLAPARLEWSEPSRLAAPLLEMM